MDILHQNRRTLPYIGLFLFALFLRVIYLWEIKSASDPIFTLLVGDAECFDVWAQGLWKGDWVGTEIFYQAPLYPYFLGVLYTLFGRNLLAVKIVQVLIGSFSCMLLAVAGGRFFSRRTGLVAGFLLAVYPAAIFFDALIQKAVLTIFFMVVFLLILGNNRERLRYGSFFAIGVVLGLFSLTRENAILLFAGVVSWIWLHFRDESSQKRWICLLLMIVGASVIFFPVAVRNKVVGNEFLITTSNFGTNLYIGNHSGATGKYEPLRRGRGNWQYERQDATAIAEQTTGRKLSPSEVSRFWTGKVFDYIRSAPLDWVRLMVRKWMLMWSAMEVADSESIYGYALVSKLLHGLNAVFHFGVLFPLAVLGICISWKQWKQQWILYVVLLLYAASVTLFFVFSRYRYPLAAILMLFAAAGIMGVPDFVKRFSNRQRVAVVLIVVLAIVFSNFGLSTFENTRIVAEYNWNKTVTLHKEKINALYHEGRDLYHKGKTEKAIDCFREVILLDPGYVKAYSFLGSILYANGRVEEAARVYHQLLCRNPSSVEVLKVLAVISAQQGNMNGAIDYFKKAAAHRPEDAGIDYSIACMYARKKMPNEAVAWLRQAFQKGYDRYELLQTDMDLDPIRESDVFQVFVRSLKERPSNAG